MQLNQFWPIPIHRNFDLTIIDQRTNGETEAMSRRVGERRAGPLLANEQIGAAKAAYAGRIR
jgi:hypothetical protein